MIDARDVLEDPRGMLAALCDRLGVPFDEAMLSWPPGPRETDGVWAKHWYANVEKSTTFQAVYDPRTSPSPTGSSASSTAARTHYAALHRHRLTA